MNQPPQQPVFVDFDDVKNQLFSHSAYWHIKGREMHMMSFHNTQGPAVISRSGLHYWYVDGHLMAVSTHNNFHQRLQEWAKAALVYEGMEVTPQSIEAHIRKALANVVNDQI